MIRSHQPYSSSQSEIGKPERIAFSEEKLMTCTLGAEYSSFDRNAVVRTLFIFCSFIDDCFLGLFELIN